MYRIFGNFDLAMLAISLLFDEEDEENQRSLKENFAKGRFWIQAAVWKIKSADEKFILLKFEIQGKLSK